MKVCFNGCSFTVGEGFSVDQRDHFIYDRLVAKKFNFDSENIAIGGSSNYKIFMRSAQALLSRKYDLVVTQWSALNRVWFKPGPDSDYFVNDHKHSDFKYREIYLSRKQKEAFNNTILMLNHDYQNILDLIDYCNFLSAIAGTTKIIFINGLVPWTKDLNSLDILNLSMDLSDYTKEILDFNNRDDYEITKFLTSLQNKFSTLDQLSWVNLFDSFDKNTVDSGPEGHHPGPLSHSWMANQLEHYLRKNSIL